MCENGLWAEIDQKELQANTRDPDVRLPCTAQLPCSRHSLTPLAPAGPVLAQAAVHPLVLADPRQVQSVRAVRRVLWLLLRGLPG